MCGFSADIAPNNELGVGSVGSYYWQGKLYSVPQIPRNYQTYSSTGKLLPPVRVISVW